MLLALEAKARELTADNGAKRARASGLGGSRASVTHRKQITEPRVEADHCRHGWD